MTKDVAPILEKITFNADGLVPAIAQCAETKDIFMMAWMNEEAVTETLQTGRVCYWSRSRQSLWRKGETSGQQQHLKEMRIDCDGDTLLLFVEQQGVACHTGRRSCFFYSVEDSCTIRVNQDIIIPPDTLYNDTSS